MSACFALWVLWEFKPLWSSMLIRFSPPNQSQQFPNANLGPETPSQSPDSVLWIMPLLFCYCFPLNELSWGPLGNKLGGGCPKKGARACLILLQTCNERVFFFFEQRQQWGLFRNFFDMLSQRKRTARTDRLWSAVSKNGLHGGAEVVWWAGWRREGRRILK